MTKATARAHPNIAFVKYWGRNDAARNLPANPSLSMNLGGLTTVTTVEFQPDLTRDLVSIDGQQAAGQPLDRVVAHLDRVRFLAGIADRARVDSRSSFPAGTGLASSASAFAALSLAAARAAGLELAEADLSRLARLGSGSACRSVPAGFVLWDGDSDATSLARQVAPPEHWALHDVIAVVSYQHKRIGSQAGHDVATTSPYYASRLATIPNLLATALSGIERRDLATLGPVVEADALAMHAVMMTSQPSLFYWQPGTIAVMHAIHAWRRSGWSVYFSMDAGPNVHCFCEAAQVADVDQRLRKVPGVKAVLSSGPGAGAQLLEHHLF